MAFLSTPSGWRATVLRHVCRVNVARISIHALRVEGDRVRRLFCKHHRDFYPRPPGGGRPRLYNRNAPLWYFYPRPPGGGRLRAAPQRDIMA